jgi:hypothetical protein
MESVMKKIFLILVWSFTTLLSEGQWNSRTGTSASDTIKICGVSGTSSDRTFKSLGFSIVKSGNEEPVAYLTYWPHSECDNNRIIVMFDEDKKSKFQVSSVTYSGEKEQYSIRFKNNSKNFFEQLKTHKIMYIRLINDISITEAQFTLENSENALKILE